MSDLFGDDEDFGLPNRGQGAESAHQGRVMSERAESVDLYGDVAGVALTCQDFL